MKKDISSLELHYLLREFQPLLGGKVEQVYQLGREELVIQFHVPSIGKRIMRFILGKMVYLASSKPPVPETPPGFCLYLRKRLCNARLRSVRQLGFERIMELIFENKDQRFKLVVELFSTGNIVLCDEKDTILSVLEQQEWKDRSLKPRIPYTYPGREFNPIDLKRDSLASMLIRSNKDSLVKALAIELGLGGVYAEELCIAAKVGKTIKPNQLTPKEVDAVSTALAALFSKDIAARVVFEDPSQSDVKDVVPFPLSFYEAFPFRECDSFNQALDSVVTVHAEKAELTKSASASKTKLSKVEEIISQQTQRIAGLEASAAENQRKGEVIYENYPLVEVLLREINEIRKKSSWTGVKESFRSHKLVRKIDEKTGEITVEL